MTSVTSSWWQCSHIFKTSPFHPCLGLCVLDVLLDMLLYLQSSCTWSSQENERTKDMIIEQRFHRAIIGQKGENIKEVRDKFPEVRTDVWNTRTWRVREGEKKFWVMKQLKSALSFCMHQEVLSVTSWWRVSGDPELIWPVTLWLFFFPVPGHNQLPRPCAEEWHRAAAWPS